MIRRPPRSTLDRSSAASDVYKRQAEGEGRPAIEAVLQRQTLADTALIIYTSGSTGKPKGAMIGYGNVAAMAAGVVDRLGLVPSTSHLSYLPLCHVAEQMLTVFVPLCLGSRVDFGESIRTVQAVSYTHLTL